MVPLNWCLSIYKFCPILVLIPGQWFHVSITFNDLSLAIPILGIWIKMKPNMRVDSVLSQNAMNHTLSNFSEKKKRHDNVRNKCAIFHWTNVHFEEDKPQFYGQMFNSIFYSLLFHLKFIKLAGGSLN